MPIESSTRLCPGPSTEHVVAPPTDRVIAPTGAGYDIGPVTTVQLVGTAIADQRVVVVGALRILDGDETVVPVSARDTRGQVHADGP